MLSRYGRYALGKVAEFCSEAMWLDGGQIRMQGSAEDVVEKYRSEVSNKGSA